ncbi:fas apoptotic inhibitory molecule 1-like [Neosynchiropus ocellatus]
MLGGDAVASWEVELSDGVYKIQFSHGSTTGKRVVTVNGHEVIRRDWMFKLVGKETFTLGDSKTRATIHIEAVGGFSYQYSLDINGKSLQTFLNQRAQTTETWILQVDGVDTRVVLEKDKMDVWCNGQKMETTGEFVLNGTETRFLLGTHECVITATSSSGKKRRNVIVHHLLLDGQIVKQQ